MLGITVVGEQTLDATTNAAALVRNGRHAGAGRSTTCRSTASTPPPAGTPTAERRALLASWAASRDQLPTEAVASVPG
jgi:hypothetical protein